MNETRNETNRWSATCGEGQPRRLDLPLPRRGVESGLPNPEAASRCVVSRLSEAYTVQILGVSGGVVAGLVGGEFAIAHAL